MIMLTVLYSAQTSHEEREVDSIILSVFGHRFMAIAEQMGRALQKTSVGTNFKERLDFSCAIFDAMGGLLANAPHLPVHLGSMSTCVKRQAEIWKGNLKKGDVIISKHPSYGGTHLPDITHVVPAFNDKGGQLGEVSQEAQQDWRGAAARRGGDDEVEYEERRFNLGAKNIAPMKPGERIVIHTPGGGGGGWGKVGTEKAFSRKRDPMEGWRKGSHTNREDTALQM
ncbi:Uncharacterized protein CTA2_11788 [Colletotrichum tanaceti]|uniref:Hydantoinase B/oxoprolinase domain-containing protein n=1 Tax=Colletotrichum tanaceti TaxID=1306861 RepID=A0A4U6XIC6_9PEZI|nr:Uncharacterized protein CTA2_11788 [Colletotrichum tanaceti]TKW55404.1 uncharacterized protein CTA1_2568 [Colletotrichum tanaceti]